MSISYLPSSPPKLSQSRQCSGQEVNIARESIGRTAAGSSVAYREGMEACAVQAIQVIGSTADCHYGSVELCSLRMHSGHDRTGVPMGHSGILLHVDRLVVKGRRMFSEGDASLVGIVRHVDYDRAAKRGLE